jgi:hypothetical protein
MCAVKKRKSPCFIGSAHNGAGDTRGGKWTANQWNYNEVPGGPSGAWNNGGAC